VSLILSVISLFLCFIFFFFFRRYIDRRISAEKLLDDYRTEVYRLIAEIDAATDRDSSLAEERVKTLRQLLEDTDKRISVYLREQERSRRGGELYTSLGKGIRAALTGNSEQVTGNKEQGKGSKEQRAISNEQLTMNSEKRTGNSEQGTMSSEKRTGNSEQGTMNSEQGTGNSELSAARKPPSASQAPTSKDRKKKMQIAEMSAQGLDSTEIASRLKMSLTEVDLALSLLNNS